MSFFKFLSLGLVALLLSCESESTPSPKEDKPKYEGIKLKESCPQRDEIISGRYNVAFLIVDGTFNTELTAPYDIFHHTKFREGIKAMNVFTISNTSVPIKTFEGLIVIPTYNFLIHDMPKIDILVIPSAEHNMDSDLEDKELIDFVRRTSKDAKYVVSHCDGAFVLAKAGVLDDHVSTTFPADIEAMRVMFPNLDIRDETLFVHDGNVITSSGGAKSFEASLYLCELLYGKTIADEIAEGMVIDWDLESVPHTIIE